MEDSGFDSTISLAINNKGGINTNFHLGMNHAHFASLLHSVATGSITDQLLGDLTTWAKLTGRMQDVTTILEIWRGLVEDDTPCIRPSKVLDKFIR